MQIRNQMNIYELNNFTIGDKWQLIKHAYYNRIFRKTKIKDEINFLILGLVNFELVKLYIK